MPAQEEVPEFTQHAFPLAQDLTNLSRVLLQALAYAFGKNLPLLQKKTESEN